MWVCLVSIDQQLRAIRQASIDVDAHRLLVGIAAAAVVGVFEHDGQALASAFFHRLQQQGQGHGGEGAVGRLRREIAPDDAHVALEVERVGAVVDFDSIRNAIVIIVVIAGIAQRIAIEVGLVKIRV